MPKKRLQNYKQLQGQSSNTAPATNHGGPSTSSASVNERLSSLRNQPNEESDRKKRQLAEFVNQRSVPPELRSILGVPESEPPKPKVLRFRDRMRTPGPPPPKSWTRFLPRWHQNANMRHGKRKKAEAAVGHRARPDQLMRFSRMTAPQSFDGNHEPIPISLEHLILKRLAEQWDAVDEVDYPELVHIPLRLRLKLLSYLSFFGAPIDIVAFEALTQGDNAVEFLDLAALIGYGGLSVKKLLKAVPGEQPQQHAVDASHAVLDSWDMNDSFENAVNAPITFNRFANLTHLCLSHPAPTASWRDLLALAKHIPQVTHLSLAYWPRPTLTPNLATTTVSSPNRSDVTAGGSNYYSAIDNDLTEPSMLLRQLSGKFLRIQWLDLEGCAEWMPALGKADVRAGETPAENDGDGWSTTNAPTIETIFNSNWKNLSYLNCAQGVFPPLAGVTRLGQHWNRHLPVHDLKEYIKNNGLADAEDLADTYYEHRVLKAELWSNAEMRLFLAGRNINRVRRSKGLKPVMMDYGWIQRAP
ncbi:Hypothetical protein R9X50_00608000 [Acrodontium crateriforme]|uniref:Tafazzin n=1 Tax=Acrodontium crateriforme TaxID=150365 RepID=A0AAQ3MAG8_9PEZI|nr:Hypothetical protein R9X50_00608000 [Acrodontium crateriforme]